MDYVPVYEEATAQAPAAAVYISPEKQQLIGVKKEKVQKRKLSGQILTVGRVAYDPALFTAQQEYLQTLKSSQTIQRGQSELYRGTVRGPHQGYETKTVGYGNERGRDSRA